MSNGKISSADLELFLTDLESNINTDDNTDYKKLILYLFSFTNDQLVELRGSWTPGACELLRRLVSALELVLSKRLHLLNEQLDAKEIRSIDYSENVTETSQPLYEWALSFALNHLVHHTANIESLNLIKSFIINIINLVTTKLHSLKYRKLIRDGLILTVEQELAYLLTHLASSSSLNFQERLIKVVQLFTILNDFDLSNKLGLNVVQFHLRFESFARKLWFVLTESAPFDDIDDLKSILIINLSDTLFLNEMVEWSQISNLLSWMVGLFPSLISSTENTSLPVSVGIGLLKVFKLCVDKNVHYSFVSYINVGNVISKAAKTKDVSVPLRALHLINYCYGHMEEDLAVVNPYQTSDSNQYIITPFGHPILDSLRSQLLDYITDPVTKQIHSILFYISDADVNIRFKRSRDADSPDIYTENAIISNSSIDYMTWISHVKYLADSGKFTSPVALLTLLNSTSRFPCLVSNDYNFAVQECTKCAVGSLDKNPYDVIDPYRKPIHEKPEMALYYNEIICGFLLGPVRSKIETNPVLCCSLLISIYNLFASYNPPSHIENETVFKFLLQILSTNSNRDVRLLITRILPMYLIQPICEQTDMNFKLIFRAISSIEFASETRRHFGESTIKAFVELSIISRGEWLCVLFIKLIDLLGENNEQHVNYVYNGFIQIASAKKLAPYKLLSPYLPSIAEVIIKKARIFSKITELLGITKKFFLNRTKEYTTPRLLEYYKSDFIQEIAEAAGMTKPELIKKNLPRIIATYLVKIQNINERYIISVLSNINPKYKKVTLPDLISRVGEITWFILLQIQIGDDDKFSNEPNILSALNYVAKVSMKQKNIDAPQGSFDYIHHHLGENVLELVQKFSENVHHITGTKPFLEKVASLRAIEFLINKNISSVTIALGQISTCLQASLENSDFQYLALKCWNGLVQNLPSNHLITLIDIIISLIFQKFRTFESKSKVIAVEILKKIYEGIKNKYSRYSLYYLSIPFLDYIQEYMPISGFKNIKQMPRLSIFSEFTRRLKTSNEYVVQQALQDLRNYCQEYQINCQMEYFRDPSLESCINDLIRTILDTASKFKNRNETITTNCAIVLSVIGSLDSNKFNFKTIKNQIIMISDFKDYKEICDFLIDFIESMVLKIFWASNNPVKQLFSAYAMQRFLEVMNLDSRVLVDSSSSRTISFDNNNLDSQDHLLVVWNKFSDVAKSTLTPLLNSKYVAPISRFEPLKYPYFRINMKFDSWLIDFTSNLLRRPLLSQFERKVPQTKEIIFETCSKLIKDQDISLCNYLLKYVAMSHIMNGNESATEDVKVEFLQILNTDFSTSSPDRVESLKNCFHTVFEVLDYFNAWVSSATQYINNHVLEAAESSRIKKHIRHVNAFLGCIPMELIAIKSSECDSYERTILYLEKCYRGGDEIKLDNSVISSTLQLMYSNINDFDALNGVLNKFSTNNLTEKLSTFQYNENWSMAQETFKVMGDSSETSESIVSDNTKLIKSLSDHGSFEEVLTNLNSKSEFANLSKIPLEWSLVGLQASIQSGDIMQIKKWLFITDSIGKPKDVDTSIVYEFAKGIQLLFEDNFEGFQECMRNIYKKVGSSLVSSISSSFSRNTNLMNQLHVIYDFALIIDKNKPDSSKNSGFLARPRTLVENEVILKARLQNIDQGFESQFKVLTLHQVANKIKGNSSKLSELLLQCSSLARKNHRLDISTRSIVKSMVIGDENANIEYSKLLWSQSKQTEAIKSLNEIIQDFDSNSKKLDKATKSRVQLQYAKWLDESNHLSSVAIINEYTKAIEFNNRWEKPYYDLGVYYNKLLDSTNDITGYYEQQIVRNFSKALAVGNSFIFEALPKLITIWLDFAQKKHKTKEAERKLNQIIEDIERCINTIPIYIWYTSITQLLSRIIHEHKPSFEKLSSIIFKIIKAYPHHSLWYILSHSNSNDTARRDRINGILRKVKGEGSNYGTIIENARELFDSLIKIATYKIPKSPKAKRLSLTKDFNVTNLSNPYTSLVIPVRSNLEIRLPNSIGDIPGSHGTKFNAFPKTSSITFDGFDDVVNIFYSLQMPRQITIRGSDNKPYRLMVKRDDTRKDAKVVEFTTMINRLLLGSTEARKRNLQISNYSVVALTENMGVIEFVTDVQTMKSIINEQRRKMGHQINERKIFMKLDEAQKMVKSCSKSSNNTEALNNLCQLFKKVCADNPPILNNWFVDQFADPTTWYMARNNFIRTSGVMSMVGYIIGLGDRHCENILFFKKNGSVLHIDFDCLFEKGLTLPTPEIVPFRLTQNMVDAMGICGIEGSFRITCEVTGGILRENEAPLMNILETLLYDPLLDWKSLQKPEAHLSKVRRKIRGLVEKEGLPMNIHGQVDVLIQEATSEERLSRMYGGWAPYI